MRAVGPVAGRRAAVPAEVVQLVADVRHRRLVHDPAVLGVDHGEEVGLRRRLCLRAGRRGRGTPPEAPASPPAGELWKDAGLTCSCDILQLLSLRSRRSSRPSISRTFRGCFLRCVTMAQTGATRIQLCGRLVVTAVRAPGRGGAAGREGAAAVRLPRAQPLPDDRPRRVAGCGLRRGGDARPQSSAQRPALEVAPRRRRRSAQGTSPDRARAARGRVRRRRGGARSSSSGGNRTSRTASGPRPGARPASPTTSPAGLCSGITTGRGSTNGADASTTCECAASSASRRHGSDSAGRRCPRPRNARVS